MKHIILKTLDDLFITYENFEHEAVFTCDDAKGVIVPGKRVKSLLIRNKNKTKFYMIVLGDEKMLDANALRKKLGEAKISFTDSDTLYSLIGVRPGHVSPFALIKNTEKNIKVIFDYCLKDIMVGFHPGQNDNTTVLNMSGVEKYLDFLGFEYEYMEI
ncbi:prolyl-tRNA synthetase associated domain-containing protein [Candidatus Gracilibacteria bacterium]|nr:prolyl-tRNA synthetase associated domain-containing protein [Candidatus Gracilibacteria bacterium]